MGEQQQQHVQPVLVGVAPGSLRATPCPVLGRAASVVPEDALTVGRGHPLLERRRERTQLVGAQPQRAEPRAGEGDVEAADLLRTAARRDPVRKLAKPAACPTVVRDLEEHVARLMHLRVAADHDALHV